MMTQERQSNIEMLRIIAMFMILAIHANMISLPRPDFTELTNAPIPTITRYLIESIGIVGVNIFVFISGWFLIKTRAEKFLAFVFQIILIKGGGILFLIMTNRLEFSFNCVLELLELTRRDWFVKSYIVLMIIAPILNKFIENSSERLIRNVIIGFFLFSSIYGWVGGANRFFVNGYTPLLFIGLYLLGHYTHMANLKQHADIKGGNPFVLNKYFDLSIYFLCISINTFLGIYCLYTGRRAYGYIYAYTNPITVIGALYLLLFFSKTRIKKSKVINFMAAGSFAAYLIHSNVYLYPYFTKGVVTIYNSNSGVLCLLLLLLYLACVYMISTIIDRPRIWMWKTIINKVNTK